MGRTPRCNHEELKKGPWTVQEDQKLIACVQRHGTGSWRTLSQKTGLQRCGKSCRLRWFNYLRPDIKRGQLSEEEKQTIIRLHAVLGNRWSTIAKHLPMRTDNQVKNYWNSYLIKHLEKKGVEPLSPKPTSTASSSSDPESVTATESNSTDSYLVSPESTASHEPSPNQVCEPTAHQSQHGLSKSSSTQLLNKVARKIVASGYLDVVKSLQPINVAGSSRSDSVTKSGIGFKRDNITESHVSSHSSTSAQLLNKMATSLSQKVHGLEAAKAVFSRTMEGGVSDGSGNGTDQVRCCLADASPFEEGTEITRIIGSPSRMLFSEVATPSCVKDNEDNWQCVSSNYISFGGVSGVSEVNLISSGNHGIESPKSPFGILENGPSSAADLQLDNDLTEIVNCEDEISKYLVCNL